MKRTVILIIVVVALLGVIGWKVVSKTSQTAALKQQSSQRKNAPAMVTLATAGPRAIAQLLDVVGTVESPNQVKLSPNTAGRIDYLQVREGDVVHKGDILCRIDPAEVEGEILQAQATLAEAQQKLSQARITENANTVTIHQTVTQNQAGVASSKADYNETIATLEATIGAAHEATVAAQGVVAQTGAAVQTAQANEKLAEANLVDTTNKYKRTFSIYEKGFDSPQDVDDARAAQEVSQQTVNANKKQVDAANSVYRSAQANERAAAHQEEITKKKAQSDIEDAKAKLTQASAVLDTSVANIAQIPAYTENLRALYSEVVADKAALKQAIARRAYLVLTSSIDGAVTQRLFDPGAQATPGTPILVVQSMDWLFVTSAVPVEYSSQVKIGLPLTLKMDALPGQVFHSPITDLNKSADPTSRQFMIRTRLQNSSGIFRPGMYARIEMTTSHVHAAIAVPREAITTDAAGNATVEMVDDKMVAHVVPVTIGVQDNNYTEIKTGLVAGQKVVTLSYRPVKDGGKVTVGSWSTKGGKGGGVSGGNSGASSASGAGGTAGPGVTTGAPDTSGTTQGGGRSTASSASETTTGATGSAGPTGAGSGH